MANREWNIPKEKPKSRSAVLIAVALVLSLGIGFASGYLVSALSNGTKVETSKNDEFSSTVKDQPASASEKKQSLKVKPSANSQVKPDISSSSNSSEKTAESEPESEYETATDEPVESDIPMVTEDAPQADEYVEPTTYEEDVSYVEPVEAEPDTVEATATGYSPEEFQLAGEIYDDEWRYTWYSQNVLPGEGLDIPGRHVEDGYVVDGEGNVVLASCDLEKGSVVDIPVGTGVGKVYDYCPISGTLDVYVDF